MNGTGNATEHSIDHKHVLSGKRTVDIFITSRYPLQRQEGGCRHVRYRQALAHDEQGRREGHFALVGTSRKELVYIRRIKEFQDHTSAKLIALAVTLGITCGQAISSKLSELMRALQK